MKQMDNRFVQKYLVLSVIALKWVEECVHSNCSTPPTQKRVVMMMSLTQSSVKIHIYTSLAV